MRARTMTQRLQRFAGWGVLVGVACLTGCTAPRWPDTVEYERLQDLGMRAMADTLGDQRVVHETVPLYLRAVAPSVSGEDDPNAPVAWQVDLVQARTAKACGPTVTPACTTLGLTFRYDATPTLSADASTTLGLLWAVPDDRPTVLPEGFLSEHGTPRWIRNDDGHGHPLVLRSLTFQASQPMTVVWRFRSKNATGEISPWVERSVTIDSGEAARAAFCAAVRRSPSQRPGVQRSVLVNDGCETVPRDTTLPAFETR